MKAKLAIAASTGFGFLILAGMNWKMAVSDNDSDTHGFNACVLESLPEADTDFIAVELLNACARKNGTDVKGEPLITQEVHGAPSSASAEIPIKWPDVVESHAFMSADRDTRDLLRRKYLEWVITPPHAEQFEEEPELERAVRLQFFQQSEKAMNLPRID